jgi:hypothetical protein
VAAKLQLIQQWWLPTFDILDGCTCNGNNPTKTSEKDEEIKLLKHQLYEKDEEIRRHQKAMKTICSDLKFALEAAKELRQQENPWLNESITDFMFYNLENAYATAQFGERNPPYSWRGNWDLVGAVMS